MGTAKILDYEVIVSELGPSSFGAMDLTFFGLQNCNFGDRAYDFKIDDENQKRFESSFSRLFSIFIETIENSVESNFLLCENVLRVYFCQIS